MNHIGLNLCKAWHGEKPLRLEALRSRISLESNVQVGCYLLHSNLLLTIYSSGLPTTSQYYIPLLFETTKSWLHKHHSKLRGDVYQADQQILHPIHHVLAQSNNADSGYSTTTLHIKPSTPWPRMNISKLSKGPEAARIRNGMKLDVSISIS